MKYNIILHGQTEFYKKINNKTYNVLKVDTIIKEEFMCSIFKNFIKNINTNIKEKHYLGIDFEFKQVAKKERDIALMQINLENDSNIGYIFVLYPPSLIKENYDLLITLITQKRAIKILHGSESLDIPYLFNQILITLDNINNFCHNFYDTKYLCDYNHIVNKVKGKCSIYDLLLDHNIITPEKVDELENIENITGPIYLITMDIYNLDHDILRYSLYDVIYLPELIKKFLNMDIIYTKIIPELSHLISKYKRLIETQFNKLVLFINSINVYYIYDNGNRIILKEIWDIYYYTISDNNNYLTSLREINYFKHFCEIITKCIVYLNINKYFKIHKNKNEFASGLDFNIYLDWLQSYTYINKIIMEYNKNMIDDLNNRFV